jgi:HAMP domain-containing protein
MAPTRSLQVRITVAFALLLLLVQAAGLVLINSVLTQSTNREIEQKLAVGQRIFSLLHEENSRQLAQAASILSSDFAFREAAATNDRDTMISALVNQGARINADISMLAGLDNIVIADTLHPESTGRPFMFSDLSAAAHEKGAGIGIVTIDGKAYDLVVVPVYAPVPIAWLAMGFIIDEKFARRVQSLTSLEASFWSVSRSTGEWTLLAATMPAEKQPELVEAMAHVERDTAGTATLNVGGEDYVTAFSRPETHDRDVIVTVLQKSLGQELGPLRKLQAILVALGVVSLLATVVASAILARGMTRPISALSEVAQKMEEGDYSHPIHVEQHDEIGRLASAFNHMRHAIAAREAKIGDMANRDVLTRRSRVPNAAITRPRSCSWTSTASKTSTTPLDITSAIYCCGKSRAGA